ncbi:LytR/AlgR family response regulator transcription factor [Hymenobacter cellulosivorans]|uniref:LytTR family DNA-binding domain-containing protein n=1 Tax=Hymenobacter cellulosivorans TaxID=2932249 RepID=A0ABY4F4P1_9BACT|nr:LytTR family DNA-binding domain-containing protein [Hymenobacter cellulosivorans]UOQ51275.1 LytTR family DNA-binding domain-containing protein [Hymenobacter cellulosivorans]
MIRCLIIDDEPIAREGLREFVREFDFLRCIGEYANASEGIELLKNKEVDLIFLDIEMPRINGLKFAEMIDDNAVMIIFTTAYPQYALRGYKVNAIDYLLKPIFFEDFEKAVLKAKSLYELMHPESAEQKSIFFKEHGAEHRIFVDDILYVKSLQNYVQLHLSGNRTITIHKTLKALQGLLPIEKFIQIHRSYVVQAKCITSIDGFTAHLSAVTLPIARERKQVLMELLAKNF